jgi:hypothetical protein
MKNAGGAETGQCIGKDRGLIKITRQAVFESFASVDDAAPASP